MARNDCQRPLSRALQLRRAQLLRRAEAQRLLAIGPTRYKDAVRNKELIEVHIGRARRLPLSEVERFIAVALARQKSRPGAE